MSVGSLYPCKLPGNTPRCEDQELIHGIPHADCESNNRDCPFHSQLFGHPKTVCWPVRWNAFCF